MEKPKSRPVRWAEAIEKVSQGLDELNELREEYEEMRDNVPENLQGSAFYEKLNEVVDAGGYDEICSGKDELEGLDLPLGFGRD